MTASLPGDSLLFTVGILVASHVMPLPLWLVVMVCAIAAFASDQIGYLHGRRFHPSLFSRPESPRQCHEREADPALAKLAVEQHRSCRHRESEWGE